MHARFLVIARGHRLAPGLVLAWRTTLGALAGDVRALAALGYRSIDARRWED